MLECSRDAATSTIAISSEVETCSREGNASKQKLEPGSDSIRTGNALGVTAVLAEQVELLLHRAVGEGEQHGVLVRLVGDPVPAWHHEQIARAPFEGLV